MKTNSRRRAVLKSPPDRAKTLLEAARLIVDLAAVKPKE